MNKSVLILIISCVFLASCEKESHEPDKTNTSIDVLDGWQITKTANDFIFNPRDLFFINADSGFVVGYNGEICRTTNAGLSWTKMNSGTTLHLYSVYFFNGKVGFVSGEGMNGCLNNDCGKGSILLKTIDGGLTWSKKFFPDYYGIYSLRFFNKLQGLAIIHTPNDRGTFDFYVARTADGGNTWERVDVEMDYPYDKFTCAGNIVFIPGTGNKLYKSTDLGYNWQTISTDIGDMFNICFIDQHIGYINAGLNIYKTTDSGLNWAKVDFPFNSLGTVHFYNENEGFNITQISEYEGGEFPVFKGSICYQTHNAGNNWKISGLNDSIRLGITQFPQKDLGYSINSDFYTIKKK
jgi:photosystem II stability/assembly factor-like uncharacterized protein